MGNNYKFWFENVIKMYFFGIKLEFLVLCNIFLGVILIFLMLFDGVSDVNNKSK